MPSKKQYDLVQNDDYDSRIPLHPDEAFQHGILFHVKVGRSDSILYRVIKFGIRTPTTLLFLDKSITKLIYL